MQLAAHALGVLAADAPRHRVPKWLRFTGKPAPATLKALAPETEPPQVSSLVVAQIQWQRTGRAALRRADCGGGAWQGNGNDILFALPKSGRKTANLSAKVTTA